MSARADIGAIGLRIRERRMAIGLTQDALAKKLDVTAQAVSKWETGVGCPDIYVLPDIAQVLEISVDALLGIVPMQPDQPEAGEEDAVPAMAFAEEETDRAFHEAEKWVEENEAKWDAVAQAQENREKICEPEADAAGGRTDETEAYEDKAAEENPDGGTGENRRSGTGSAGKNLDELGKEMMDAVSKEMNSLGDDVEQITRQVEQKVSSAFGASQFGASLTRYINSTIRSAMGSMKTAHSRDISMRTNAYGDDSVTLRGLDIDVSGSGEIAVKEGAPGTWSAQISAPDFMFSQIVCQPKNGILYLRIPSISQFGYHGNSPKVRVLIHTGFTLGESLRLNVRGSADTKIEPDFEHSEVHIAGSGDVEMANAGELTYSVAGSGDLAFGDAQNASVRISGSGDAHGGCLTGRTSVHISGSGDFAADAVSGTLEAVAAGSGDFSINEGVLETLKIRISGSGDFYGPNLETEDAEIRITGGGDVVLGQVKGNLVQNISKSASVRIRRRG